MNRIRVRIVEIVEEVDELGACPRLHVEVEDMKIIALGSERCQSHRALHMTSLGRRSDEAEKLFGISGHVFTERAVA